LRAGDSVLVLHTLRFHDELVSGEDLEIERGRKPSQKEIDMAGRLVDSLAEKFDPAGYEDTYRDAVLDLIKRKAQGEEIDLAAQEQPDHGDDLAAALEASLAGSGS
jgi:DNA end-binding protein Ku